MVLLQFLCIFLLGSLVEPLRQNWEYFNEERFDLFDIISDSEDICLDVNFDWQGAFRRAMNVSTANAIKEKNDKLKTATSCLNDYDRTPVICTNSTPIVASLKGKYRGVEMKYNETLLVRFLDIYKHFNGTGCVSLENEYPLESVGEKTRRSYICPDSEFILLTNGSIHFWFGSLLARTLINEKENSSWRGYFVTDHHYMQYVQLKNGHRPFIRDVLRTEGHKICPVADLNVHWHCSSKLERNAMVFSALEGYGCIFNISMEMGALCEVTGMRMDRPDIGRCVKNRSHDEIVNFVVNFKKRKDIQEVAGNRHKKLYNILMTRLRMTMLNKRLLIRPVHTKAPERKRREREMEYELYMAFLDFFENLIAAKYGRYPRRSNELEKFVLELANASFPWDVPIPKEQRSNSLDSFNMWLYFKDPNWDRTFFPLRIDFVDLINEEFRNYDDYEFPISLECAADNAFKGVYSEGLLCSNRSASDGYILNNGKDTYLNLENHQAPYFELKGFIPNGSSETDSFVQWMKHGINVEEDDWLLTAIMKNFLHHLLVKKAWKGMTFDQKMNQIAKDVTAYCVLKFWESKEQAPYGHHNQTIEIALQLMELMVVRMTAFDEKDDVFLDDASKWNDNNMKDYLEEYTSAGSKGKSLCKDLLAKHYDKIIGKADRLYNTDIQINAATTSRAKTEYKDPEFKIFVNSETRNFTSFLLDLGDFDKMMKSNISIERRSRDYCAPGFNCLAGVFSRIF